MSKKAVIIISIISTLLIAAVITLVFLLNGRNASPSLAGANGSSAPDTNEETPENKLLTYEEYNALSGAEQEAYFNTFPSIEDFISWYNLAREQYEKDHPTIEIDPDGTVDIGDIVGGK